MHLPAPARAGAIDHARQLALAQDDPAAAAALLLRFGDPAAADARLASDAGRIDGSRYESLVPPAKALRSHDCPRGETAVYRVLLKEAAPACCR